MEVRVHVASCNTRHATELCVRTARARAGVAHELVVGDCGSTDGSLAMLRGLERKGWLTLEVAEGRAHADWLDAWLAGCPARYAVFSDSDVLFRRRDWLAELIGAAERQQAAIVAAEWLPEQAHAVEPVGLKTVRLAARPAPWLLLADVEQLRGLDASFRYHVVETSSVPEGLVLYDVGGWLAHQAAEAGLRTSTMPADYASAYHHFGGLSWGGRGLDRTALRKRRDRLLIRARLAALRRRQA